mgnify:CR=1 FL=1
MGFTEIGVVLFLVALLAFGFMNSRKVSQELKKLEIELDTIDIYCIYTKLKIIDDFEAISINTLENLLININNLTTSVFCNYFLLIISVEFSFPTITIFAMLLNNPTSTTPGISLISCSSFKESSISFK